MSLLQRIILLVGCFMLLLIWIKPPVYQIHPNGTRLEHDLEYFWHISTDWSANVPLMITRIAIVVLITTGLILVFDPKLRKEAKK